MQANITSSVVLLLLGAASVACYIHDLDFLVVACQLLSLIVLKKIPYDRCGSHFCQFATTSRRFSETLPSVTTS